MEHCSTCGKPLYHGVCYQCNPDAKQMHWATRICATCGTEVLGEEPCPKCQTTTSLQRAGFLNSIFGARRNVVIGVAATAFWILDVFSVGWGTPRFAMPSIGLEAGADTVFSLSVVLSQTLKMRKTFGRFASLLPFSLGVYGLGEFVAWNHDVNAVGSALNVLGVACVATSIVLLVVGFRQLMDGRGNQQTSANAPIAADLKGDSS